MDITSAQYIVDLDGSTKVSVKVTIDGKETVVPIDPANRHYAEILRQVEAGVLTIQEAE